MSLALTKAAPLKAEIRLAQAVSQFEADLSTDQKAVFRAQRSQTRKTPPDAQEVMRLTAQIDRETSKKMGGGRCFGPRFTNVLHAVQQFAALGDVIIGGSQNIIACGVWSLVRMTLLSLVNYSSCMDKLSTLLMVAGRSAPRYQKMALLYSRSKILQSSLSEYFIVVVRLCHHLLKVTKKTLFGQLLSFLSDSEIKNYESELLRWASNIKEETSLLLNENVNDHGDRVKGLFKLSDSEAYRQKLKAHCQLLDSCSTFDNETPWKEFRKAGNVTLLSSTPEYKRWRCESGSSTLLWKGKLGAGKSVLLANIVDDLNLHVPGSDVLVTYFFCRHDISESLSARTVVGSLARQLLRSIPPITAQAVIDVTIPHLDCKRILSLLQKVLPPTFRAYFVLDGLDECDEEERLTIVKYLQTLQQTFGLLVCLSFRVEAGTTPWLIPSAFTGSVTITIPEENPDIACFISSQLERCIESGKLMVGDPAIVLEIEDALLRGSQGMFLWVALQIESLYTSRTDAAIREALANLPKDLPETFSRIVQRSGQLGEDYQIRIFKLVIAAFRPLTVEELREALSVAPGDATWNPARSLNNIYSALACCGSLIAVNEEALTIKLIHHSVKQFLIGGSASFYSGLFTTDSANQAMGETIVTYLNYGVFGTSLSRRVIPSIAPETSPSKIVKSMDTSPSVQSLALRFLQSRRQFGYNMGTTLAEAAQKHQPGLKDQFFFYSYATEHWLDYVMFIRVEEQAFCSLVVKLITKYASPDCIGRGPGGEQPLFWWAVESGHGEIVRALLDLDAGTDLEARNASGMTPLCSAVWAEQSIIVDLLIDKGANLGPSLVLAILKQNHAIASILLCRGADPNAACSFSTIDSLVRTGSVYKPIFEGDIVKTWDAQGQRDLPLALAIAVGDESMVKLLLDHRPNLLRALHFAVEYRHPSIVEILLAHGAPINQSNNLLPAIRNGDTAMVRVLLENGAAIECGNTRTDASEPIYLAIEQDHDEILGLLLEKGTAVERTPFMAAALCHAITVDSWKCFILLARGRAHVHYVDQKGRTPFSYACQQQRDMMFINELRKRIYYDFRSQFDKPDKCGRTPLSYAAQFGRGGVVLYLMDSGAKPNSEDTTFRTPLNYAAAAGFSWIVNLLLDRGAYINLEAPNGSPLIEAIMAGSMESVRLLLEHGADPWVNDKKTGLMPLAVAEKAGTKDIANLLRQHMQKTLDKSDLPRRSMDPTSF